MKDNVGVLLPVASLPSKYGIGDFGKSAYMEGYDSGYCLVSISDPSCPDLSNRGIIDCNAN